MTDNVSSFPPPVPSLPPAGWYKDPSGQGDMVRYWDGNAWTSSTEASPASPELPAQQKVGQDPSDPVFWMLPTGRSSMAVIAGYLGIVALFAPFFLIVGPLAILFGFLGLREIKRDGSHGKGRAIFAILAGIFSTAIVAFVLIPMILK